MFFSFCLFAGFLRMDGYGYGYGYLQMDKKIWRIIALIMKRKQSLGQQIFS